MLCAGINHTCYNISRACDGKMDCPYNDDEVACDGKSKHREISIAFPLKNSLQLQSCIKYLNFTAVKLSLFILIFQSKTTHCVLRNSNCRIKGEIQYQSIFMVILNPKTL